VETEEPVTGRAGVVRSAAERAERAGRAGRAGRASERPARASGRVARAAERAAPYVEIARSLLRWAVRAAARGPHAVLVSLAAIAAMIVAANGIETFGDIAEFVSEGGEYAWVDGAVLRLVAGVRSPALTDAFLVITHVGTGAALVAVALAGGGVLAAVARSVAPPLLVLAAIAGMAITVFSVKVLIARPRPAPALAAYAEDGYGFPSGHTANTTTVYLMLAVLTWIVVRTLWIRVAATATAVLVSVVVGVSRVVLGVHSPTDVLAGWVLAVSWVIIVIAAWALARNLREALAVGRSTSRRLMRALTA
jgi:membrane-associated phospholipid phosphatase